MRDRYQLIGDVRGPGLMIGVELVKSKQTNEPARQEAHDFVQEGLKRGVIFGESKYLGLGNIIKVKPPLAITDAQVERMLDIFEEIPPRSAARMCDNPGRIPPPTGLQRSRRVGKARP